MSAPGYSYFDESYFQEGSKRGTAYVNYKESARESQTFKEIAQAVHEVFQPLRVLDVGCATGAVVRRLNELGCEAHGVDVSEWAVRNAEHPNVRLASADNLPYPDGFFDLVMSCHSMEHLPNAVFEGSIREITRVSSAFLFHMLPMVGTPPYSGDAETVREQLRKDPTHQQLHSKEWWVRQFEALGCIPVETCILFSNEASTAELSTGQFTLKRDSKIPDTEVLKRACARNQLVFRDLQIARMKQAQFTASGNAAVRLSYIERVWKDVEKVLESGTTIDLTARTFRLVAMVDGNPAQLRFAAGRDIGAQTYAEVGEFHFHAKPGCNVFTFTSRDLRTLRGSPDYSAVNHLAVGGENDKSEILFYLTDESGASLL